MNNVYTADIRKVARIHDKATNNYLEVVEFPKSRLHTGKLVLPPSVVADKRGFERHLRDAGAELPKVKANLVKLLDKVAASDAPEEWIYEAHTGWINDRKAFVTATEIIGTVSDHIVGVNQSKASTSSRGIISERGREN